MDNVVINIEHLSKQYRLGTISHGTLAKDLQSWWARARGKEDPNSIISTARHRRPSTENDYFWALQDISLEVKRGEAVGIIGRNGAGKSTLLKVLSRVTAQTKGVIKIRGRVASLLEVGTGFHPELTGRENIYLNGAILGMTKKEIDRKFDEILDFAEVHKFIDTPVKRYSSGMYVRLAFAVAAHLEPEILIVDEVLAVGDAQFQKKCMGKMSEISSGEGKTILFVSHNMVGIRSLCKRAVLLEEGRIVRDGPSAEVVDYYLTQSVKNRRHTQEYPSDDKKQVQIRKVTVCDHNGVASEHVDLNKKTIVRVEYEFKEPMSNMLIGINVVTPDSDQYLLTVNESELDLSRLGKRAQGYYTGEVIIPEKILNTGTYRLRVGAVRSHTIHDVVDDIFFDVIDTVGIFQGLGYERKSALLSIQLPWTITNFIPYVQEHR
jgi:lipopolysaccharide transport system ATP-binding protein